MRRVFLITIISILSISLGLAQQPTNIGALPITEAPAAKLMQGPRPMRAPNVGSPRGSFSLLLDYDAADAQFASNNSFDYQYFGFALNKAYDVSCTPLDTVDDISLNWASVLFGTFYDNLTGTIYPLSSITATTVDSVGILFNHVNNSGLLDTLVLSVHSIAATPTAHTFSTPEGLTMTNTVLWSDTLFTNQSLTANTGGIFSYKIPTTPGGVTIPSGGAFIVQVQYFGPVVDTFNLIYGNRFECGTTTGNFASTALINRNSFYHLNALSRGMGGCTDLSGYFGVNIPSGPAGCQEFYLQNAGIFADVSFQAQVGVLAFASADTVCPGDVVTLDANVSGGSGTFNINWTGPAGSVYTAQTSAQTDVTIPTGVSGVIEYVITVNDPIEAETVTDTVFLVVDANCPAPSCPGPSTGTPGFRPDPNNVACIVQNVGYNENVEFEIPTSVGGIATVNSVTIDSITNLPCGISYSLDQPSATYNGGEVVCITFTGTTTDPVGEYQQGVYVTLATSLGPISGELSALGSQFGIPDLEHYLRVKATAGAACPNVGTGTIQTSSGPICGSTPLSVTASANPSTICNGDNSTLTATATGGSGSYTYTWMPGSLSGASVSVSPSTTTTYTVTVNDGSGTATATTTVTVNSCPTTCPGPPTGIPGFRPDSNNVDCIVQNVGYNENVEFEIPASLTGITIDSARVDSITNIPCGISYSLDQTDATYNGGEVACITFSGTTTDAVGQYQQGVYVTIWTSLTGAISGELGALGSQFGVPGLNHYLRVKATAGATCPNIVAGQSLTSSGPTCGTTPISVSASANPSTTCAGDNSTLTAVATGGSGSYTYTWMPGSLSGASVSVSPSTTTTYTVTVNDGSGTATATTTVTVSPSVAPSVSIAATPNPPCAGSTVSFTATATNGGTSPTYAWTVNSGATVSTSATFSSSTLSAGDVVAVTLTSSSSCASPTTATDQITIQNCSASCPGPATGIAGFRPDSNNVDCIVQNLAYSEQIEFELPANFSGLTGWTLTVDSLTNLPCGIDYSLDQNPANYGPSAVGCVTFFGTTTDPVGQYKLGVYVTVTGLPFPVSGELGQLASTLNIVGFNQYLRVKATSGAACPNIVAGQSLTSSGPNCVVTPLTVSASASPTTVCANDNATLTATATGGSGSYTYSWSPGGLTGATVTVAPASTTTYTVTANDGINTATATTTVTVTNAVVPAVSITSNPSNPCANTSITFTATPTNGGALPTYDWSVNGTPVGNGSTYTTTGLSAGDVVSVVLNSSANCASPATAQDQLTVVSCPTTCPGPPTGTPGFRPDTNNVPCIVQNVGYNENVEFEIPASLTGVNIDSARVDSITNIPCGISYSLDQPDATYNGGEVACITFSGTTTDAVGQYKQGVYVTIWASILPNGISGELSALGSQFGVTGLSHYLRVKATAGATCPNIVGGQSLTASGPVCSTAQLVVSAAASPSTICSGATTTLTATASGGTGTYTYSWMPGSLSGASVNVSPTTTTTYTVTVNDGVTTETATVTVTVNNNVTPSVSITSTPTSLCEGQSFNFTANPTNGGNSPSYSWLLNGNQVSTGATYATSGALSAGDVVTVILTSSETCVLTPTANASLTIANCSGPLTVSVTNDTSVCAGGVVTLTAAGNGGTGTYTYTWSPPTGLSATTGSTVQASPSTATTYTVTVNDGSNTASATVEVTVGGGPTANAGADVDICPGGSAQLLATGGVSYSWTPTVGLSCSACANPQASPGSTTTYVVTVTDGAGCTDTDEVVVTVTNSAQASVTISASNDPICQGTVQQFTASPVNGGTPDYQWYRNGTAVGQNSPTYTVSNLAVGDEITVEMTSSLACVSNATVTSNPLTVVNCVGIAGIDEQLELSVVPNPSTGVFFLTLEGVRSDANIEVYNLQGQRVYTDFVGNTKAIIERSIDISEFSAGLYLLRVSTESGTLNRKLILE